MSFAAKRDDLPYLDGLRALAALIVVASHFGNLGWANFGAVSLAGAGKSGVFLFFLLSAYLLTRVAFLQGAAFWTLGPLTKFFVRRTFRIFPLFIFYLLVCVLTTMLTPLIMDAPRGFPYSMSWTDVWRHLSLQDGKGVLWSIPVEFKYYFTLPLVALGLWQGIFRAPKVTIGLVVVLCVLVELYLMSRESRSGGTYLRTYIQIFLLGSAFAAFDVAYLSDKTRSALRVQRSGTILFFLSAGALVFMMPTTQAGLFGDHSINFNQQYLLQGLAWLGVLAGLRLGHSRLHAPFEFAWCRYIGLISFSLYLWHEFIIAVLSTLGYGGFGPFTWILPLGLSLALSHMSFHMIEKPFLLINPAELWSRFRTSGGVATKR